MYNLLRLFLLFVACSSLGKPLPEFVQQVVGTIHSTREAVEFGGIEDRAAFRLKGNLERISETAAIDRFTQYALGSGLLYLDDFREDLNFLTMAAQDPVKSHLMARVGFDRFAFSFGNSMEKEQQFATRTLGLFKTATEDVIGAQDDFLKSSKRAEVWLWTAHSSLFLAASFAAIYRFWDMVELDAMTPREVIGFLGGVWGGNLGSYWGIYDYFKWIDPFRQIASNKQFCAIEDAWDRFGTFYPDVTLSLVAAAADDKPVSSATHCDPQSNAALDSLKRNRSEESTKKLHALFLSALDDGKYARVDDILEELSTRDPSKHTAQMREAILRVFKVRRRMELKSFRYQVQRASLRITGLLLGIWALNHGLKWGFPNDVAKWRHVPSAILGAIGTKRLFPMLWTQYGVSSLKTHVADDEPKLEEAMRGIMRLDRTGNIVSRIARFDSGIAAQQLVTRAAADVLAMQASGKVTRQMWNVLEVEMLRSTYSGERVSYLVDATFKQQFACLRSIVDAAASLKKSLE